MVDHAKEAISLRPQNKPTMKIDNTTFLQMQADLNLILPFYMVRNQIELEEITEAMMHHIWFEAYANRTWADNDPKIYRDELGERILSKKENYDLYPCDTNDTTISTALNKIRKALLK